MPISAKTTRVLREVLGAEAADDLLKWMHEIEVGREELRELRDQRVIAALDARFADLSREIRAEVSALRRDLREDAAKLARCPS